MSDGIEKLKELANQIEREHVSELHALEERYKTDLQEAREAIKEAAEYNHQLGNIIEYIGASIRKKPVLSSQDRYDRIMSCMYRRLMPPGMEWPRFEDGMQITWADAPEDIAAVCLALDGSCYSLHYDMPDDERMLIHEVSERVKRPVTEMIGADCLPVEVAHTQPDTQERIDAEIISGYRDSICPQLEPYTREYCTNECDCNSCLAERIMEQGDRQRELDARTMGGE